MPQSTPYGWFSLRNLVQLKYLSYKSVTSYNLEWLLASHPTFPSGSCHLVLLFLVAFAIFLPSLKLPSLTLTPSISPKWCCFAHKANTKSSTTDPRGFTLWWIYFCSKHTFLEISKLTSDLGYLPLSQTLTKCSDDLTFERWGNLFKILQIWRGCVVWPDSPCPTVQEVWLFNFPVYFLVKFSCRPTG